MADLHDKIKEWEELIREHQDLMSKHEAMVAKIAGVIITYKDAEEIDINALKVMDKHREILEEKIKAVKGNVASMIEEKYSFQSFIERSLLNKIETELYEMVTKDKAS